MARPSPPYLRIVDDLRGRITSGELAEGDRIPSARQLAGEWNVALSTASKVLATLRSEGLVRPVQGVGTVVTDTTTVRLGARDFMTGHRRRNQFYPPGLRSRIVSAEMVDAPARVAEALDVTAGEPVIRRHRVTYQRRGKQPDRAVEASTSWFVGQLAGECPRLLQVDRVPEGTPTYIEQATGRRVTSGRDLLAADEASETDAGDLGVAQGTPVMRGRNWFYDAAGAVLEYGESCTVPLRWTAYEYDTRAEV
jgi:DNA-binding GntR family transcriptional regulator